MDVNKISNEKKKNRMQVLAEAKLVAGCGGTSCRQRRLCHWGGRTGLQLCSF